MTKIKGITARKNSIQISFMYKGDRVRETLKLEPTKPNLNAANRIRQAALRDIELGKFEYSEHFPNSKNALKYSNNIGSLITIKEQMENWLRQPRILKLEASTLRGYNSSIKYHLNPNFGHLYLSELTVPIVNDWISSLDIQTKTINNILTPLRMSYKWAFNTEIITKNPFNHIDNLPIKTREPQPFNENEIEKILNQLTGMEKNLIQTAFWTGMRTSELIGLRWEDIDFHKKKLFVQNVIVRGNTKGPKTEAGKRTIKLNDGSLEALSAQKAFKSNSSNLVFTDPKSADKALDDQKIRKRIWTPALQRAGISYREPYQTRHTFASIMLSNGENPLLISKQMGHSKVSQTFNSYARWIEDDS
tara:strand:+ start:556 stop:1641 length:1086 start_codon:yes stop_codon:yes gene_type:complete